MPVQQITIPITGILKTIKKKDPFVLGVASLSLERGDTESYWHEIVEELANTLGTELNSRPHRVRAEEVPCDAKASSRSDRFMGIGEVSRWRRHRWTLLEFRDPSEDELLRLGRQCDGVVAIVSHADRDMQKRVRHLCSHGVEILGYWCYRKSDSCWAVD